jgi:hypothetical protein
MDGWSGATLAEFLGDVEKCPDEVSGCGLRPSQAACGSGVRAERESGEASREADDTLETTGVLQAVAIILSMDDEGD